MPYNPNAEYPPVTGDPGMYLTPDRTMHVGIASGLPDEPPQSEQPGRGVTAPSWEERFIAGIPGQEQVTDVFNTDQFTVS